MTVEQILIILKTREKAARINGNTTEVTLINELVKMAKDYKRLKEKE